MARGGRIVGGAFALAVACMLAAPAVLAADQEVGTTYVPAPPARVVVAPPARVVVAAPAPVAAASVSVSADLGRVLSGGAELVIAGERLNGGLLRRFYARHGFEPVWTGRPAQAMSLTTAVLHAGDQGLPPELFHANLLQAQAALPPLDRELLLSDAFLSYADALARGIMPVERRRDDESLTPGPIDVAAVLDAALTSANPGAAIEALAPKTPTYRLLREALQNAQGGISGGGKAATARVRQIEVNLERERWLPRPLPADRVWVNVADERAVLYRGDQAVFSTKVIVGQDVQRNQSPEFEATIKGVLFNPPWNVPSYIAAKEILPKADRDPNYLAEHNMVVLPDGIVQQRAGPNSGLGQLMLDMTNRFDVYLHDTPGKNAFGRDDRRISHGCIRVEQPRELAALLMQQPEEAIDQAVATGDTAESPLPAPVPVFVVYETAFADADGNLQFRPDFYGRDAEIWQNLDPGRRAVADRDTSDQSGG